MTSMTLAQFQLAAVDHIVRRLKDRTGSRRMLLADEVGLGKTIVARGVIEKLGRARSRPLTVIYLCSNAEIAEQNRTKLDPASGKPLGRVTELAMHAQGADGELRLFSFTPGTSLNEGTGLAWERRLLMYLLHRVYAIPLRKRAWREFFRCGVSEKRWAQDTSRAALTRDFKRKTSSALQQQLRGAWRAATLEGEPVLRVLKRMVKGFDASKADLSSRRNRVVSVLRAVMQREALRCLKPDLVILDEVQRFRDVLKEATNSTHIASELFARRVPVLVLSATPYRAVTLGHEVAEGETPHHEDFFNTLRFLFDGDVSRDEVLSRIKSNLALLGAKLRDPEVAEKLDHELVRVKRCLEADLTQVICRTERNWYVLDRRKGVDDEVCPRGALPGTEELKEFFLLHRTLAASVGVGQVTEFWKSAPSLLTFLDGRYHLLKTLKESDARVPRALLTEPTRVESLGRRNHRIARVLDVALPSKEQAPCLWTKPTYPYYQDAFFGDDGPRKMLVFSGWRFVPKTVAIVASRVAANRVGGELTETSQPLRFTEKSSFHVFDVCFPSPSLASIGDRAFAAARSAQPCKAEDVIAAARRLLEAELDAAHIAVGHGQRTPLWEAVMRLEGKNGWAGHISEALGACVQEQDESGHLEAHRARVVEWLRPGRSQLAISSLQLDRLALIAAFSPAASLLRACESVYGDEQAKSAYAQVTKLGFGALRRYFNRPLVQQVVRGHQFRMAWRDMPSEDRGYAERTLVCAADTHLQAVLDEYVYLLKHAGQADSMERAIEQIGDVWSLSHGTPRTNRAKGNGSQVHIEENAEGHTTHFALAFGEDIARDGSPGEDEIKLRKSVVREAFNSPFWPFVLATTSVGQEGLDFHLYCRDILHWNLPSNPVDLEQREGRINRRDCLAVRESIAMDRPISRLRNDDALEISRNPWPGVFEAIQAEPNEQKYKHGLYPHWVYECEHPANTVRIRRHVPFFTTSRDAMQYERLKTGLALYRLVFGQINQEDLLDTLQRQAGGPDEKAKDVRIRRLASYMLNLSPIGHAAAKEHAFSEADALLADASGAGLRILVAAVKALQEQRHDELKEVESELGDLVAMVERAVASGWHTTPALRHAVMALAYLRNPYDHVFDSHVEGGLADDIEIIREAVNQSRGCDVADPAQDVGGRVRARAMA